jgi:hypothetical protein
VARVDEVDLVALGPELLFEQEAEDGGVGRIFLRLALDGEKPSIARGGLGGG